MSKPNEKPNQGSFLVLAYKLNFQLVQKPVAICQKPAKKLTERSFAKHTLSFACQFVA